LLWRREIRRTRALASILYRTERSGLLAQTRCASAERPCWSVECAYDRLFDRRDEFSEATTDRAPRLPLHQRQLGGHAFLLRTSRSARGTIRSTASPDMNVVRFAEREHAEQVCERFGGRFINAKDGTSGRDRATLAPRNASTGTTCGILHRSLKERRSFVANCRLYATSEVSDEVWSRV
jgi:hypothetical protein